MKDVMLTQSAIKYIVEHRQGTRDELIEQIGDELYNEFCEAGIISRDAYWKLLRLSKANYETYFGMPES